MIEYTARVSSTLNKNVKEFGKKGLNDGNPETCWNSDAGPQWIQLTFSTTKITTLQIQFQGGFVPTEMSMIVGDVTTKFYPHDSNELQRFDFEAVETGQVKLEFPSSTDFYGRVVVYLLQIY